MGNLSYIHEEGAIDGISGVRAVGKLGSIN